MADGFSFLRGPAAMFGSGAASNGDSNLLCTDGTGLPRLIMDAVLSLFASEYIWSKLMDLPLKANLLDSSTASYPRSAIELSLSSL